jgi:predicted acyl esterase
VWKLQKSFIIVILNRTQVAKNYLSKRNLKMSNYHMMVRSEVMRGRFRNSFSNPEPFEPNKKTDVTIELQDINHTFKKGHKLQIQIQSSWFPLIDMNPQTYVDNIFEAKKEDFKKQTHTVFGDSKIVFYKIN